MAILLLLVKRIIAINNELSESNARRQALGLNDILIKLTFQVYHHNLGFGLSHLKLALQGLCLLLVGILEVFYGI
ncbi:MAG: hypothetical protein EOM15_16640 [Spirochaetia bacterium]|nr:hypothetical protein [Spirochaetia bacterium]